MKIIDENAVIDRIVQLRRQYAGDRGKSKFAHDLGISPSTYSYYEKNRIPPMEILLRICELTGCDLIWLLTEKKTGVSENQTVKKSEKNGLSGQDIELIEKLDKFFTENPDLSGAVLAFIELLSEKKGLEEGIRGKMDFSDTTTGRAAPKEPEEIRKPGWIPILGRTAAGLVQVWDKEVMPEPKEAVTELEGLVKKHIGKKIVSSIDGEVAVDLRAKLVVDELVGIEANLVQVGPGEVDDDIVEFIQCKAIHELFPDSFALQIDGDSMSPRITDGDIVIVSPSVPAAQGNIAVARVSEQIGVTCKLIRMTETTVHLIPINERYETKVVPKKDLLWSLSVLCHIRVGK
ncbi:MAG: helix-turn-helix domain-containing protein [Planctomycetota bacterium]|jgi:transcriptional regulator with XRE-family HTH domain